MIEPRSFLRACLDAALAAADPARAVRGHLRRDGAHLEIAGTTYDLDRVGRLLVIAVGKAAGPMALAAEQVLERRIDGGLVVLRRGATRPGLRLPLREAGHPLPNGDGLLAAERVERLVAGLAADDLVLVLLSGGASALLPAPRPPLTLADKIAITQALLASGADIQAVNAVRRRLSRLKGGGLLRATRAAIATLAISDVIGDDLRDIGSGPSVPGDDAPDLAATLIARHAIGRDLPPAVRERLQACLERPAAPPVATRGPAAVIASNRQALDAAATVARGQGLTVTVLDAPLRGEAREAGEAFARHLRASPPGTCLLAGGETTVTLGRSPGRGGRNQEAALAAALVLDGADDCSLLYAGTDGSDGPTEAAGGLVNGGTARRLRDTGRDAAADLAGHDSHAALAAAGALLTTGPTGTNVMDLWLGLRA